MTRVLHYFILVILCLPLAVQQTGCKSKNKGDKVEYKKWKKKAKSYVKNPMALKAKEEACEKSIQDLTKKNAELSKRISELQAELDKCLANTQAEIQRRDSRFDSLMYEFKKLQTGYESMKSVTENTDNRKPIDGQTSSGTSNPTASRESSGDRGIIFRVQIGAYTKFKVDDKLTNTESNFSGETVDGMNKYLIGRFRSFELCEQFRKSIVKLGIKDAWVTAYNDGVRITVTEAIRRQKGGWSKDFWFIHTNTTWKEGCQIGSLPSFIYI